MVLRTRRLGSLRYDTSYLGLLLHNSLKAVELANTLRARVGTEAMALVRERFGGLLSLLELYPLIFSVERVPKCDKVSLTVAAIATSRTGKGLQVHSGSTQSSAQFDVQEQQRQEQKLSLPSCFFH